MEQFIWYFKFGNAKKKAITMEIKKLPLYNKKEVIDCNQFIVLACFNWF